MSSTSAMRRIVSAVSGLTAHASTTAAPTATFLRGPRRWYASPSGGIKEALAAAIPAQQERLKKIKQADRKSVV